VRIKRTHLVSKINFPVRTVYGASTIPSQNNIANSWRRPNNTGIIKIIKTENMKRETTLKREGRNGQRREEGGDQWACVTVLAVI
jgi:hypothetical protein